MKVLFVAGWRTDYGDFIREHAMAIAPLADLTYVYIEFEKAPRPALPSIEINRIENPLYKEYVVNIRAFLRRFGEHDRLIKLAIGKIIKREGSFDLCHINVRTPVTEPVPDHPKLKNVPVILTEHNSFYHYGIHRKFTPGEAEEERKRIGRWLNKPQIKRVVPVSHELGRILSEEFGFPRAWITPVGNVANEAFAFKTHQKESGKIRISLAAIWAVQKNPMLFARALVQLPQHLSKQLEITWAGEGPGLEEVKEFLNTQNFAGIIHYPGPIATREEMAKIFSTSDFFVHPTNAENLPCVIIENLCCGTPILSNDIPGVDELVNSTNGLLAKKDDVDDMRLSIEKMISQLQGFDREKISTEALSKFSSRAIGEQYFEIYKNVTGQYEFYRICTQCVMDTDGDPDIRFTEAGICNYCIECEKETKLRVKVLEKPDALEQLTKQIKSTPAKKYNCLLGVSGGADSSYSAMLLKEHGLNPLLVHIDNGWNSESAVMNIENLCKKLDLDLYTWVIDWKEFRDVQLSLMKASVVDIELATDLAMVAGLYRLAAKFSIPYIITGHNYSTESIMPPSWNHAKGDLLNLLHIHKKFGTIPLKSFPVLGYFKKAWLVQVKKIKVVPLLNYVRYDKEEAKRILERETGWKDHSTKHGESIFTRFYQNYILPEKFNIDKRKAHLSSLICSGQISKAEALEELKKPLYDPAQFRDDKTFVLKKFRITEEEFEVIMQRPRVEHNAFPSYAKKHYYYEVMLSRKLKPVTRIIRRIFGIRAQSNYV